MRKQDEPPSAANTDLVDYEVNGDRLTLDLKGDISKCSCGTIFEYLGRVLTTDIKSLLIDKKGFKRESSDIEDVKLFGHRFGRMLQEHRIQAALVLDPQDFFETAMCVFAMETGAKIMTTDSRHEAALWLEGGIN